MKEILSVPTGEILILDGDKGKLECLSIGDYGKQENIKADFLGLSDEINGVSAVAIMPLEEKWVITISTQYGCSMNCTFCDVPKVGRGVNATLKDLTSQVITSLSHHPEVLATKRLNLHYARMGEPTWNFDVISHAKGLMNEVRPYIGRSMCHPVVSTMMPKRNKRLGEFIAEWVDIKNNQYRGGAGLQLSINSTDDKQREKMFSGNALSLHEISSLMETVDDPVGRKYTLNFALADEYIIDAELLARLFPTSRFMVKITPLHATSACSKNGLITSGGYKEYTPYEDVENRLKAAGFDVLIFIPSIDEDMSLITCGNAVLSQRLPWARGGE